MLTRSIAVLALVSCFLPLPAVPAPQESASGDHVKVRFLLPERFSKGDKTLVGILFEPDPDWHVYWRNPGDSGAAPKFDLSAENARLGPVLWPAPTRLPVAHLTNLGYEGAVAYLFRVTPDGRGPVRITAGLEWLVCKVDCIPGFAGLDAIRPLGGDAPKWEASIRNRVHEFADRVPGPARSAPFQITSAVVRDSNLILQLGAGNGPPLNEVDFYPVDGGIVSPAAPSRSADSAEVEFELNPAAEPPKRLSFVAASPDGAWEFERIPVTSGAAAPAGPATLWLLLLSAVAGGLLLNLMPCVFPVISIKALSLLKAEGRERVQDCLLYAFGVLGTFAALGVLFLLLRSFGAAVGWGFQLQSPYVVLALILLFWTMALAFLDAIGFGTSIMNTAGRFSGRSSSFGTGVLSVFIATPCTGPFMGTALGAAATLPAYSAFLIFIALGIGLASPFLLFAASPRVLSWLPRPGAWMNTLKQFLAFPLFATVLWLLWVLDRQTGADGWLLGCAAILGVSFALWVGRSGGRKGILLAWLIAILSLTAVTSGLSRNASPSLQESSVWMPYDEVKLARARAEGQAVFVDFTAAWCITCQINKEAVLNTGAARAAFRDADILLMRADWTRYDPVVTRALEKLGRNSVPVYAFYPGGGGGPELLPQVLTLSMIEELIPDE